MNEFVDAKALCCNGDTSFEPDSLSLGKWLGSNAIHFLVRFPLAASCGRESTDYWELMSGACRP